MEKQKTPGGEFIDAVCAKVRFKPARQQIAQELQAHLEDRAAMLEERGFPPGDAAARAAASMGDPAEIGAALDQEHSPLWGWAAIGAFVVRCVLILFVLLFVWMNVSQHGFSNAFYQTSQAGFISAQERPLMTISLREWHATEHLFVYVDKVEVFQYAGPAPELINDFTVRVSYTQWYRNPFLRSDRQYVFDRAIRDETGAVYQDGLLGDARPQVLYIELAEPDGAPFVLEVPLDWEEVEEDVR